MAPRKRTFIDFRKGNPVICAATGGAAAETANTRNHISWGGHVLEIHNDGANDQIIGAHIVDANALNGWEIPLEEGTDADGDGIEVTQGILADAGAPYAFTVGTDGPVVFELEFAMPVVADFDLMAMGFRKAAAYVADFGATPAAGVSTGVQYTDAAGFNFEDGVIYTFAGVNQTGGGTGTYTYTDSTETDIANDDIVKAKVLVSAAGVVTFECTVNGTALGLATVATGTFDTGDVIVPWFRCARSGTGADTRPILRTWRCGLFSS